ncbi:MAG: hypothetical protein V1705_00160 [bacterium]
MKKISKYLPHVAAMLFLAGFVSYAAWTEPPTGTTPPDNNVPAPINVGAAIQYKSGALGIGGVLRGYADAIFDGKVGIGTTNPQGKLDLFGSLAIGGNQGTAGQILQSQGPSLTPTWITAPKYYEFDSPPALYIGNGAQNRWIDWTISEIPAGATAAFIAFDGGAFLVIRVGARRYGSSRAATFGLYGSSMSFVVQLDSSMKVQVLQTNYGSAWQCLGYWK